MTDEKTNLYEIGKEGLQEKISDVGQKYTGAISSYNESDIVEKMRLKTGGVADLDTAISNLEVDINKARPALMERYANVIDPGKREALISAEESNLAKQMNDLSAVRKYRLGSIKDMAQAEVDSQAQKLKGLEAQYNLYNNVMGDLTQAEKTKQEMEKTALAMQSQELQIKALEEQYGMALVNPIEGKTSQEMGPLESNVGTWGNGNITGYGSPKWKWGMDVDGKIGDPIAPKIEGQVTFAGPTDNGFGNQVRVLDSQGNEVWYSHLDKMNVKVGQSIGFDEVLGTMGNTGDVLDINGNVPTAQQLKDGVGSHLDVTIKKPDGTYMSPQEVEKYIEGGKPSEKSVYKKVKPSQAEIEAKKESEEDKKDLKFEEYVRDERDGIVEGLISEKYKDVGSVLNRLYPDEKDPMATVGRTLSDSERTDIMENIWVQEGIKGDKSELDKFNDMIKEYASLFYPDEDLEDIEYELGQEFLELGKITPKFLGQNLAEKFNDQFD